MVVGEHTSDSIIDNDARRHDHHDDDTDDG